LYVSNSVDGTVSVIRTSDDKVVGTVTVGGEPWGIVALPNGNSVYVVDRGGSVSVIGL